MYLPRTYYKNQKLASGPGIHTDEASSALPSLIHEGLPAADARLLSMVSRGVSRVRSNPDEREESDDWRPKAKSKKPAKKLPPGLVPTSSYQELIAIAFLCTGQWGIEAKSLKRQLPLLGVRENPKHDRERLDMPFFERMEALKTLLISQKKLFQDRYDANAKILAGVGLDESALAENESEDLEKNDTPTPSDPAPLRGWVKTANDMLTAVNFLLAQRDKKDRSIFSKKTNGYLGLEKNAWGALAKDGNQKLPFVAYSELPMATCPGAGACGVALTGAFEKVKKPMVDQKGEYVYNKKGQPKMTDGTAGHRGWCYSFTAWRYPDAFRRQALNTLANYADREFAILKNGGPADPAKYAARVEASINGEKDRAWTRHIEQSALEATEKGRAAGKKTFMRLFVDGDINTEDNIYAWMRVCKRIEGQIEVYGYTKCWQQFLNVHKRFGEAWWPKNYVVNLSSGSVYVKSMDVRAEMEALPISRGYFEAINLHGYIKELEKQTALLAENPAAAIPMDAPEVKFDQFRFSEERIRKILRINAAETWEQAISEVPTLVRIKGSVTPDEIRRRAFQAWLTDLVRDPEFGTLVRVELARDNAKLKREASFYERVEKIEKAKLVQVLTTGTKDARDYSLKTLTRKALSLVLQETLWTYGLGGSCPLVCGNCSDDPTDATKGVHRCAAKKNSPFWHAKIHIGLH